MKATWALVLLLVACTTNEPKPEGLLTREQFTEVLLEAQLIEARINHELIVQHLAQVPTGSYYKELFEAQGITEEQFTRTFTYYAERPKELKDIYDDIVEELQRRKGQPVQ